MGRNQARKINLDFVANATQLRSSLSIRKERL